MLQISYELILYEDPALDSLDPKQDYASSFAIDGKIWSAQVRVLTPKNGKVAVWPDLPASFVAALSAGKSLSGDINGIAIAPHSLKDSSKALALLDECLAKLQRRFVNFPTLGDQAVFEGSFSGEDGGTIRFTQTLHLSEFERESGNYTLTKTIDLPNGTSDVQVSELPRQDLASSKSIEDNLRNCATGGGRSVEISVPAGNFEACHSKQDHGNEVWIAAVPFGFVREVSFDEQGNRTTVDLVSFRAGE